MITVKLELQGMREQILAAFSDRSIELGEMVRSALQREVNETRFKELFEAEVKKALQEIVDQAVREIKWDPETKEIIRKQVRKALMRG